MTDPYEELKRPSPLLDRLKRANPLLKLSASGDPPTPAFPLGWSTNQDRNVVITMTPDDYSRMLFIFAQATGDALKNHQSVDPILALLNRINFGKPDYTPYQVEPEEAHGR